MEGSQAATGTDGVRERGGSGGAGRREQNRDERPQSGTNGLPKHSYWLDLSFSTWCCSSSCTSCPDCFTETSRMWPLERILNTTDLLNKEDFQLPNSRPLTSP